MRFEKISNKFSEWGIIMCKSKKTLKPKFKYLVSFVIAIVIIAVLFFILELENIGDKYRDIISGFIVSIIASLIFFVLTEFIFDDKENIERILRDISDLQKTIIVSEDIKKYGIQSIKNISHEDESNKFWIDILNNTKEKLYIMAHTLSPWFQEEYEDKFFNTLKNLAINKKEVYIIILKPNGENLKYMNIGSIEEYSKKILISIKKLESLYYELPKEARKYFVVKLNYNFYIPYTYIRNEKQVCVSPYLFNGRERSNFIVTFDTDSLFAHSFNNDFRELFHNNNLTTLNSITLVQTISTKMNKYSASNWEYEDTYKYIFLDANAIYEVGYYVHYDSNKTITNYTIELATSYGCPFKCKYCASSSINNFQIANEYAIFEILKNVYTLHHLKEYDKVHITFTGTGDFYFTKQLLCNIVPKIHDNYSGARFTLSSCCWNNDLISAVENMNITNTIKHIQITYLSSDVQKIKTVIPNYIDTYQIKDLVDYICNSSLGNKIRVNYIMIRDFNDKDEDFDEFINIFEKTKDKILVRISKLNETKCSRSNNLFSPDISKLEAMLKKCKNEGYNAYIFYSKENDNMNCGQLITEI